MNTLRIYATVFRVSLSERLTYRFNFLIGVVFRFLPMVTTLFLWRAVYQTAPEGLTAQYTFAGIIAYYVLVMVARSFSAMPGLARTVAQEIRDGELNKYLVRPVDYLTYTLSLRLAHKAVFFLIATVPFAFVIAWLSRIGIFAPWPGWPVFAAFLLALVLSFFVGFLLNVLFGLIGFWFLEINTFLFLYMMIEYFVSGHMFPIDLMPEAMARIFLWLPFQYEAYFPVAVFLKRYGPGELAIHLFIEMAWILGLWLLVIILYRRGLRRYGAYGG
ncbi:MAG: ABC-2 family transporter protein [Planctomycetes bacterium]|nr:ABC-2 family transporter protein [Planctomycetota bacterium]